MGVIRSIAVVMVLLMVAPLTLAAETKPLRALFIGNSYTAFNGGLPKVLGEMAKSGGRALECDWSVAGGKSLEWHWTEGKARDAIAKGGWDVVVLQDFSMQALTKKDKLFEYARKFDEQIKGAHAKTVFYMTWARQDHPENQAIISDAYQTIARELNATVAPVGLAWQRVLGEADHPVLHFDDKSHPNPVGFYLTACVFYQVLLGEPAPKDVPAIKNQRTGEMETIPADLAAHLRGVANEIVRHPVAAAATQPVK